ncbi:hypothetical protein PTSG_06263 [Salpingoeca rosetta]|uniref:peptidylprolyl isomerase n=1 Tax=Salpingoeca rosetta (strain ATCC 50818 / BSB-021) TaxID=946362 RepID=F2UCE5_SALR5|nr:uncharacterized protein PTSG_06263 [Salpingoeca rosetta]EGD74252.1 hypothetical protein PTSG_06263 [Salpingoeca rosetta]|eukprot:XP_004993152.1 hypothetical protein PTSG_06263 [Salpingoeca rosetta]
MAVLVVVVVVAVLAVTAGAATAKADPPLIKWSQTAQALKLHITHSCPTAPTAVFERATLLLTCSDLEEAGITLELREDIVAEKSECHPVSATKLSCSLTKEIPHAFDRLEENPTAFSGRIVVDWESFDDSLIDETESGEDAGVLYADTRVTPLSTSVLQANPSFVVVDADLGWCRACNPARRAFVRVARRFHEQRDDVVFAHVDLVDNRALRHSLNKTCDGQCVLHIYSRDTSQPRAISFDDEEDVLYERVSLYTSAPFKDFSSPAQVFDSLIEHKSSVPAPWQERRKTVAVVGVFGSADTAHKSAFTQWGAANATRELFILGLATSVFHDIQPPAVVVFRSEDGDYESLSGDAILSTNLTHWALIRTLPPVVKFTWTSRETLERSGLPVAHLFVQDAQAKQQARALLQSVAASYRDAITCTYVTSEFPEIRDDYGIHESSLPAFGIAENAFPQSARYPLITKSLTQAEVAGFVSRFLAGELTAAPKTEAGDTSFEPGHLAKVSLRTFEPFVDGDRDVLLFFCHELHPSWQRARAILQETAHVLSASGAIIGVYNIGGNAPPPGHGQRFNAANLKGFLWTHTMDHTARPKAYTGSIKRSRILKWLKANVPAVKKTWAQIQANVKELKAQTGEEKARKRGVFQEFVDQLSHLSHEALTQDGGVVKHVIHPGSGKFLTPGSTITVHMIGSLPNGTVFENTMDDGVPYMFKLGTGMAIRCWDIGVSSMSLGERAYITCDSEYGYSKVDTPKTIPPHSPVRFEIEVIESEPAQREEL